MKIAVDALSGQNPKGASTFAIFKVWRNTLQNTVKGGDGFQ